MMERHPHTNLWADKLQQVPVPDVREAWMSMEMLLDKEMPLRKPADRRRWFLLILLLLLLIGVCNCPGRGRWFGEVSYRPQTEIPAPAPPAATRTVGGPPASGNHTDPVPASGTPATSNSTHTHTSGRRQHPSPPTSTSTNHSSASGRTHPFHPVSGNRTRPTSGDPSHPSSDATAHGHRPMPAGSATTPADTAVANHPTDTLDGAPKNASNATPKNAPTATPKVAPKPAAGAVLKATPKAASKDSLRKKPAPPSSDTTEKERGFMAGIGLNQFFAVGGQQSSNYNSGGISGTLGDYIPVPMIRYYFNHRLYVQLEAQFNTPQYTKKNLEVSHRSDSGSGQTTVNTVAIKKLFYFNLPLSVHYSPFDNVNVGAGLQFSRLSNAIGFFDQNVRTTSGLDTSSVETKSFKGDSLYQRIKTNEFRFLLDVSYTWRHFIVGVRYNQALSKFINLQVAPGIITQSRNSSLQLYLRYILWDGRKKKLIIK